MLRSQPFPHLRDLYLSAISPQLFPLQDHMLPQYLRRHSGVVYPPLLCLHFVHITAQQDGSLLSQFVAVRPCFQFTQRSLEDSTYTFQMLTLRCPSGVALCGSGDDALAECSGPWCSEALTPICPLCAWLDCHIFMLVSASLVLSPSALAACGFMLTPGCQSPPFTDSSDLCHQA